MTKAPPKPKVSKYRKSVDESRKKQKVETPQANFKSAEYIENSDEGLSDIETGTVPASEIVEGASASKTLEYDENAKEIEEAPEIVEEASVIQLEVAAPVPREPVVVEAKSDDVESEAESDEPTGFSGSFTDWEPTPRPEGYIGFLKSRVGIDESTDTLPTLEAFLRPFAVNDDADPLVITHTSMNGRPFPGKWSIPFKENWQFIRVLHNHIFVKGLPAYFSERVVKGKAYYFFMDFDFDADVIKSIGLLDRGDHAFFEFVHDLVEVCLRETEVGRHRCDDLIMSGKPGTINKIHVNADFICQDPNLAPSIMRKVEERMKSSAPDVDWKNTFDTKPYSHGLRMLGCSKAGEDVAYQVYNFHTRQFEPTTSTMMGYTTIRSDAFGYWPGGSSCGGGSSSVDPETECQVQEFVEHLRSTKAFGDQPLGVKKVKMSGGRFINVALTDTQCPYIGRAHNGNPQRLYLFITHIGVWLKCWDTESCAHGRDRACLTAEMKQLMSKYKEEGEEDPPEPEIGDVCGGGESDEGEEGDEDEEATAVERPKKIRKKTKPKKNKRAAPKEDVGDRIESPALDKSVIRALYDDDADRYDQPALTGYLNRFIAYIHQNDTYGFRLRDDQPYDICKKAAVVNKMERFEIKDSPFSVWCKNKNRREFTDVVFDTSDKKYPPTTLNLFCGYKAKMLDRRVEAEEVEIFLYHLRDVICRGHEENFHFYLFWWAWFFQKGRTGIMVILLSELKGTGKNILLELITEYIIGDKYVAVTDKIDTVVQRFNAIMVEKALIVANELKDISKSGKESSRVEEVLKTMIKDRTTAIEKKGIDPISIPSTANFHGTSQYQVPLKIDRDQRRFVLFDVSPHKKGDFAYFETLAEFVKTHANEIFTYLHQVDLTGWSPEKNLVQTEYTKRAQRAFVNPIHQFWYDSGYCDEDFETKAYPKDPIYKQYAQWCLAKPNKPKVYADTWFGRQIVSMGYTIEKSQAYGERGRVITGKMSDEIKELMLDC